jgi:FkbM family methyltransferase
MPGLLARASRLALSSLPIYNGKGRIIDRTALGHLRFAERTLDVRTADGFVLRVDPNDLIGRHIYLSGRFDRCVVDVLRRVAQPGAVLWDIGANIGYVSCAFLAAVPRSAVVAVEPLTDVHDLLTHNLAQFGEWRSVTLRAAISDRRGQGTIERDRANLGRSHLVESGRGDAVPLATGAALADASPHSRVDLVKIDVECHEAAVFRGIASQLDSLRPRAVVFEHHCEPGAAEPQIMSLLADLGYSAWRLSRRWSGWRLAEAEALDDGPYELSSDFVALEGGIDPASLSSGARRAMARV